MKSVPANLLCKCLITISQQAFEDSSITAQTNKLLISKKHKKEAVCWIVHEDAVGLDITYIKSEGG